MDSRVPVDRQISLAWTEIAHTARLGNRILGGVPELAPGSNFEQINAIYPSERSSDWHRSYLEAALQHLLLWADLVAPLKFHPEQEVIQAFRPAYTLGRAALEAASQAVWMSSGDTAKECARRHLSLIRWDYVEHRKSVTGEDAKRQIREMDARLLDRVGRQFNDADLTPPTHLAVLRNAALTIDVDPDELERVWRAASGSAHGKFWPSVALQQVVPLHEYEPGQFRAVRVPDPAGMTEVLRFAERMTTWGVFRHADFSGADIPQLAGEARCWLVSVAPIRDDADQSVIDYLSRASDDPPPWPT